MTEAASLHATHLPAPPPRLRAVFAAFLKVGLTSFGGGMSGWIRRLLVVDRRWMSEDDFAAGLAMARALPGVNIVNLSLWMGFALRGTPGALAALGGVLAVPFFVVLGLALAYERFGGVAGVHGVLAGVAAAAIGLSLELSLRMVRRVADDAGGIAVMVTAFVLVGVLKFPTLAVVLGLLPVSLALTLARQSARRRDG